MQQPPRVRRSQRNRAQYPDAEPPRAQYPGQAPPDAAQTPPGAYPPQPGRPIYPPGPPVYPPNQPGYPHNAYTTGRQPVYPPVFGEEEAPYPRNASQGRWGGDGSRPKGRSHDGLWLLVIILCVAALALGGWGVSALYGTYYPAFLEKRAAMNTDTYYNGIHVDDIHIGGLTYGEAAALLAHNAAYSDQFFAMSVQVDGQSWRITQDELPLQRNTQAVLDEAFSIGRQGTAGTLGSPVTPFESRYGHVQQTGQNGAYLYTRVTYDNATVRRLADTISQRVYTAPVDSMIHSFDFNTRGFSFTQEQYGRAISADTIYSNIVAQLDAHNYNAAIALSSEAIAPAVTSGQLMTGFGQISAYSTNTTADYNRNKNIQLATGAITRVVNPGDVFSFNEATGFRNAEKGYLSAGAIASGASIEEIGGGVCQVSSTLFNAAAMANMEIVYSSPHAWPSAYIDPGRDATVDWQSYQSLAQSLDLKFKNVGDFPVFIVSYLTGSLSGKCKCTVEIYGVSLGQGVSIQLQTELVSQSPAPTEVVRQFNAELPYGTEKEVRKARPGYVYRTYRVFTQNGMETKRELLRTSTYRTYTKLIEYNY